MAKQAAANLNDGFLGAVRNSPATKQLTEGARGLVEAQTSRVIGKVGDGITGTAARLTKVGETGELPAIGEGAKRLLKGGGPLKAVAGAVKTSIGGKAGQVLDNIKGGTGKGAGPSKALNIEESIDVGVPVSTAYNQWTQFTDFSRFMKGVESVEQTSDTETTWRAKVFKSRRTWKATIQEQVPDQRIVWTSEGSKGSTKGVVTFHPLAENLTRVLVTIEYFPSGVVEKTGNLWRAAGRRTRLDLKNFRRFVMMEGDATGEWRGEIRDGEVTGEKPRRRRKPPADTASRDRRREPAKADRGRARPARAAKAQGASQTRRRTTKDAGGRTKTTGTTRSRSKS